MSKNDVIYRVFGQEVTSIKKVSEILGCKVSKVDVLDGKVEGVVAINPDTMEEITKVEDIIDTTLSVEEGMEQIEEVLNEDSDNTDDPEGTEGDTDTEGDAEEGSEEETVPDPDTLESKLAKLRAISDKHQANKGADKGKGSKGKKKVFDGTYPEVGEFTDEKELRKFYKQLTDEQVAEWCELEGVKYKACDHQAIQRMRMCMAITDKHFPKETSSTKKKSKYADLSTDELVQMAIDNEVEVKDHKGDNRILRMYLVMALRDAGIIE